MSEKTAAEIFKKMAQSENRPEIARLRDIFEYVERALNAKTSHEVVLAGLHELGFKMNINSFRSALQRIRKERGISKTRKNPTLNQPPSAPTPTPPTEPAEETSPSKKNNGESNTEKPQNDNDSLKDIMRGGQDSSKYF